MTTAAGSRSHRTELAVLTGAKIVANTALRWVGPFLPTLERAFSSTTGTLTGILGAAELAGLSTVATGPMLDRGRERRLFVFGLVAVGISSLIALLGTVASFAVAAVLLVLGVTNLTVAGHAWIGHRVAFAARGRSIGLFETSWALSLLIGAPVIALLIEAFGWRAPFVALAVGSFLAALAVMAFVAPGTPHSATHADGTERLPRSAWYPMLASAATAAAGLGTFVVTGAWLDDEFGVPTGGLGLVAAGFGAIELVASSAVATFGDRIGSRRSVLIGLIGLIAGLMGMAAVGDSRTAAVIALLVFFAGFEFAFVSTLTLVTEAAPRARGRAIGISNACGTVARATAVFASGQLYERFGISGSVALGMAAAAAAFVLTVATPSYTADG